MLALAVFLLPPAYRGVEWFWRQGDPATAGRLAGDRSEIRSLKRALARRAADFERLAGCSFLVDPQTGLPGRYAAAWADVLPFVDPSPARRSLWLHLDGAERLGDDAAVLHELSLVGRLVDDPLELQVGRVRTVLDPLFRVRFHANGSSGILKGGERDGVPHLEMLHLADSNSLEAGTDVFTAGGDGVFPPDVWIGRVVHDAQGQVFVTSSLSVDALRRVLVVSDQARRRVARARRER